MILCRETHAFPSSMRTQWRNGDTRANGGPLRPEDLVDGDHMQQVSGGVQGHLAGFDESMCEHVYRKLWFILRSSKRP